MGGLFTERANNVVKLANEEAKKLNHEYIGTEHILLGLVREESSLAAIVLKNLGIELDSIRREVIKIVQLGPDMVSMGRLPFTPRAKMVIEYAVEEAQAPKQLVDTPHLLLGLLREKEGVAAEVLKNLGVRLEAVRAEVVQTLAREAARAETRGRLLEEYASLRQPDEKRWWQFWRS